MTEQENTYFKNGVPFYIEVEFSNLTPEIERKLITMQLFGEEILPGLKVKCVYKQTATPNSIMSKEISNDIQELVRKTKELMDNFTTKWENISNQEEKSKLESLKENHKPQAKPNEDRPLGFDNERIKSYDDVSQFPNF